MNFQEKLSQWLQIFRAPTAPLTVILTLLAYLNGNWSLGLVVFFFFYMTALHYMGFGHNSLMDTRLGYDKTDEGKQHHPLITGAISIKQGMYLIEYGMLALTFIAIVVTLLYAENVIMALICLILMIVIGREYNEGMPKMSSIGLLFVALTIMLQALWLAYFGAGALTPVMIIYILFVFTLMTYQNTVEGCLKDILQPEPSNILKRLGAKITVEKHVGNATDSYTTYIFGHDVTLSDNAIGYAYFIKFVNVIFTFLLVVLTLEHFELTNIPVLLWYLGFMLGSWYFYDKMIQKEYPNFETKRKAILKYMSYDQICIIYSVMPLMTTLWIALLLAIYGLIYFAYMNKLTWKTDYPAV